MTGLRPLAASLAGLAALSLCLACPAGEAHRTAGRGREANTEAQLEAVQAEIARTRAQASRSQAQADRVTRELKDAELSMSAAREALATIQTERSRRAAQRAALAAQRSQHEARIAAERGSLESEVRAAYLMGRSGPLKLLLDQEDPARAGRMLAYYGYFARARRAEIDRIEADVRQLDGLDGQLAAEDQRLAALEAQRQAQLGQLQQARTERTAALASLQATARTSTARLELLQHEQAGLESLLSELRRALRAQAPLGHGAFARLRGELAWPVAGRIAARFGETRAGGLKWDGELIDTQRGAEVRAVSDGRVIFADWLPGLGLLIILDHGDGYLSLYGHNERLLASAGSRVAAGEPIAAAGDSGGSARPELYFEIRKDGRPVDPAQWFRAPAPGESAAGTQPALETARSRASRGR